MKRLVLFVIMAVALVSCGEKEKGGGRLDPNAKISLRAAKGVKAEVSGTRAQYLTPLEIVTQAHSIVFSNKRYYPNSTNGELSRGFADTQRDLVQQRLMMWGTDIVDQYGRFDNTFIAAEDMVLVRFVGVYPYEHRDTIAYISNSTLRTAEQAIRAAYDQENFDTLYRLFDEAFTFIPITGPEWQELKAQGIN